MGHLPNAPVMYTLGVIRFPRVPEFEKFTDKFFDKIRQQYPYDEKFVQKVFSMEMGSAGVTINQSDKPIWQYLSPNKDCGFLLGDELLCFHTNNYKDSKTFLERFKFGIRRLQEVPDLHIPFINMIGIRYLDLVVPEEGKKLTDYLQKWVLPEEAPNEGMEILEGAYMAKYKTELGVLNFQAVRNPEILISHDLQSPFLQKNGWIKEKPKVGEFVVVDTDHHIATLNMQHLFDADSLIEKIDGLHLVCDNVFKSFGTAEAFEFWSKKK